MQNSILIISRDNHYLHDILKTEGISSNCTDEINQQAQNCGLIIFNNFTFDEKAITTLNKLSTTKKSIIIINPDGKMKKLSSSIKIIPFDLVKQIYLLNQGKPAQFDKNGVFRASSTSIIKRSEKLIPQADVLRKKLVEIIEQNLPYPLPKIWHLPDKKLAGAIFSHDSDEVTDEELYRINELNTKHNVKATTFMLIKTGSKKCWQSFQKSGQDLQLHQVYFYIPFCPKKFSAFAAKLISNKLTQKFQKHTLSVEKKILEKLSKKKISGVRNHGLFWLDNSTIPLWMHKVGIKFDSTLGAVHDYGYLHGTGLPYFLRMEDYTRLDVLEFPLHIMDYIYLENKEKTRNMTKKFLDNALKYNSIITFDFHHKFLKGKILDWYIETIGYAKKKNILIESMTYFNDFWRKRLNLEISNIKFQNYILNYEIINPNNQNTDGICMTIPLTFKNKKLKTIKYGNKKIAFDKIKIDNKPYAIFEIKKDTNNVCSEFG